MRYLALCCDYDGTLATQGLLPERTADALKRLIASGRRVVLVTGRELHDLQRVCGQLDLFEYIVAENGALLYHPATREETVLAKPPPQAFLKALLDRGVTPLATGRVIVATCEPHETTVLEVIRDLGLELQLIFNKGAVMVLPAGVNKATGLEAALKKMGLSAHNTVGIGDAENDHAFLQMCECRVAVANALPTLKETADIVTEGARGAGVEELIDELIRDDLAAHASKLARHNILLGTDPSGAAICVAPYGENVLLVGTSGSGKSTLATGLLERLAEKDYTFCVLDPEGDYPALADAVPLGAPTRAPTYDEIVQLLSKPGRSCIANLLGLPIEDRPAYFMNLLPRLLSLRAKTGRPHWILLDEAHHLLPAEWGPGQTALPEKLQSTMEITVHPELLPPKLLEDVDVFIAMGSEPHLPLEEFARTAGLPPPPPIEPMPVNSREALLWRPRSGHPPVRLSIAPSHTERRRHTRKYAQGELGPDRSFYFRGPHGKLNLRAQNLILFLQLADGVDDETWNHHLARGDYSRWMHDCIKDRELAAKIRAVEQTSHLSSTDSRRLIRAAIEEQYTLPATSSTRD